MSYYNNNQQWGAPGGQPSNNWEQRQQPPARSGASSAAPEKDDGIAFQSQFEEVDRAVENLMKSGKMVANMPGGSATPSRRDSMPIGPAAARSFPDQYDPRMQGAPRHHSVTDFGDARLYGGANLQNYYANQRHQPSRGTNEAEQVMQAKRRAAAQRERELRNYHQEQQYNRSVVAEMSSFGSKPDRTMSPGSSMSEEERRDQIARQHKALYTRDGAAPYGSDGAFEDHTRSSSGAHSVTGMRGHSPLAFEQNATTPIEPQSATSLHQAPQRSRANSNSSPSSNPTSSFSMFESAAAQQNHPTKASSRTSTSSPGVSPPRLPPGPTSNAGSAKPTGMSGVAPIGTRPSVSTQVAPNGQVHNPVIGNLGGGKRSTTPQLSSPLSYGYTSNGEGDKKEISPSSAGGSANNSMNGGNGQQSGEINNMGWGNSKTSGAGVWGKSGGLGVQASVWG